MTTPTLSDVVTSELTSGVAGSLPLLVTRLADHGQNVSERHIGRVLGEILPRSVSRVADTLDHNGEPIVPFVAEAYEKHLRATRQHLFFAETVTVSDTSVVVLTDRRGVRVWCQAADTTPDAYRVALTQIAALIGSSSVVLPVGGLQKNRDNLVLPGSMALAPDLFPPGPYTPTTLLPASGVADDPHRHIDALEAESIRIIREAVAVAKNPGMLFSMGKDSMVMWTLAKKAFYPEPPPIPLSVIDTQWKFLDMYRFRDYIASQDGVDLRVHINPDAIRDNVNPFDFGSAVHTDITKTQALKQVLDHNRFDFVFGGARRDEEKSRAKERVFSLRTNTHAWDPKNQRPELWNVYNTRLMPGQSMRVFPLSNWTELDIWRYVERENIDVVPLYFSKTRPFVERNGALIMVDDERFPLEDGEQVFFEPIRFRTLGCYPLTGGVRSDATTVADIIAELEHSRVSERSSRVIDFDPGASMEQKKKEGYF